MKSRSLAFEDVPVFLAFAKSKNAASAATLVGLSQPAFNERMRKLEAELMPSPFSWEGNKRVLNSFGKKVVNVLEPQVLVLLDTIDNTIEEESAGALTPLRVAGRNEIFTRLSPGLSSFQYRVVLQSCSSHEALQRVQHGDVDVAISAIKPSDPHLIIRKLFTSFAVLAIPQQFLTEEAKRSFNKNANKVQSPLIESLKKRPWFVYQENDNLFTAFLKISGWDESEMDVRACCDDWQILWRLVKSGAGCAVLPSAYTEPHPDVTIVLPEANFQHNPFYLTCRKEKSNSKRVHEFYEFAKNFLTSSASQEPY